MIPDVTSSEYKMVWLRFEGQENQCQGVLFVVANLPEIKQNESCLTFFSEQLFSFQAKSTFCVPLGQLLAFLFFPFLVVL